MERGERDISHKTRKQKGQTEQCSKTVKTGATQPGRRCLKKSRRKMGLHLHSRQEGEKCC